MSLVLNTNEQGGGGFLVSNHLLGSSGYPDFGQLLLKPIMPIDGYNSTYPGNETFPSRYNAITVNGTIINFRSGDLYAPICFQGDGNGGGYGMVSRFRVMSAMTFKYRVGIKTQLKGGEIIGKSVRGAIHTVGAGSGSGSITFNIRAGLLHSDGTISYCGPQIDTQSYSRTTNAQVAEYSQTNSGLVAQEGDYVIAEFGAVKTGSAFQSMSFGSDGGPIMTEGFEAMNGTPFPIEISID